MKILHTSDWHLGKRVGEIDRTDIFKKFLDWLLEIIDKNAVDALIIAGDIFDTTNPPNSAETLYYDFLKGLVKTGCKTTVIIGGNHDSAPQLNVSKKFLQMHNIQVRGEITDVLRDCIIEAPGTDGSTEAIICAVPFLRQRDVYSAAKSDQLDSDSYDKKITEGIAQKYAAIVQEAETIRNGRDIPLIATGHLFTSGGVKGDGERDIYIGNLGQVNAKIFPKAVDYLALGHLHKPQLIDDDPTRNYCGSPLVLDFGDRDQQRLVKLVDFNGRKANVTDIEVPAFDRLVRLSGTMQEVEDSLSELIKTPIPCYCEVTVEGESGVTNLSEVLNAKVAGSLVTILKFRRNTNSGVYLTFTNDEDAQQELTPDLVFTKRLEGTTFTDKEKEDLWRCYHQILNEIEQGIDSKITD